MTTPRWQIMARKFSGEAHYTYLARLTHHEGGYYRLRSLPGETLIHYTHGYEIPNPFHCDLHFWSDRWYNIFTNYDPEGRLHYFYCNVTLPPVISALRRVVSFVDLDLDVRVNPDGTYRILDEDEFEAHSAAYGYPARVRANARRAVGQIIALAKAQGGPFDLLRSGEGED